MSTYEAKKKATKNYLNSKYRPTILLDKEQREEIEKHFKAQGYKSINEYINALIERDINLKRI